MDNTVPTEAGILIGLLQQAELSPSNLIIETLSKNGWKEFLPRDTWEKDPAGAIIKNLQENLAAKLYGVNVIIAISFNFTN